MYVKENSGLFCHFLDILRFGYFRYFEGTKNRIKCYAILNKMKNFNNYNFAAI